jgi:murein DD-endopeptidase MepM/ murein hydrolase activator NlpD
MAQLVGILFIVFAVVGLVLCGVALVGHASSDGVPVSYFATSSFIGLSTINFNFFDSTGIGRDYITQGYGRTAYAYLYINGWHNGIDLAANFGTLVYAPTDGTVLAVVNQDAYCPHIAFGKYIALDDPVHHLVFVFSHLGTFAVSTGETILKGTPIGTVGPTGLETGPHLLVSIFDEQGFNTSPAHGCGPYPQGHDVDPTLYLGTIYQ